MLFVDYQNVYQAARDVFHDPPLWFWQGQIDPGRLGRLLVERSPYPRDLAGVRVYRGLPSSHRDPKGYSAARSQMTRWESDTQVRVVTRPLRYPPEPDGRPQEKGIDVALAVDFVMGAVKGWFDVGVIFSLDTDLKPALETVAGELHGIRVEVAAWNRTDRRCGRLSVTGKDIWCHWFDQDDYRSVADETDYTKR